VMAEMLLDQVDHLAVYIILYEQWDRRQGRFAAIRFAITGVEIPLSACRLSILHQKSGLSAHVTIKKLHAQLLAPVRPALKLLFAADESGVRHDPYGYSQAQVPAVDLVLQSVLPTLGCDQALEPVRMGNLNDDIKQGLVWFVRIILFIVNSKAAMSQLVCKMPHRAEDKCYFLFVMSNIAGFGTHFRHQNQVMVRICFRQARQRQTQLVAEYQNKIHGFFCGGTLQLSSQR